MDLKSKNEKITTLFRKRAIILKEMWNSWTSAVPNTSSQEQQEEYMKAGLFLPERVNKEWYMVTYGKYARNKEVHVLLCSKTMVSDMRHVSELLVPGFSIWSWWFPDSVYSVPDLVLLCWGNMHRDEKATEHFRQPKFECGCSKSRFLGWVV